MVTHYIPAKKFRLMEIRLKSRGIMHASVSWRANLARPDSSKQGVLKSLGLASTMAVCMSLEHAASRRAVNISIHEQQRSRMSLGRLLQSQLIWMLRGSRSAMVEFGRGLDLRGRRMSVLERLARE